MQSVPVTSAEIALLMQAQAHSLALSLPEQLCLSPASQQIKTDEYVLGALSQTRRATPSTFKPPLQQRPNADKYKIHAVIRAEQHG